MKAKILVVDDEPEVASSLAQSLEEKGYEVIIANAHIGIGCTAAHPSKASAHTMQI